MQALDNGLGKEEKESSLNIIRTTSKQADTV